MINKDTILAKINQITNLELKDKCWQLLERYQWNFNTTVICEEIDKKIDNQIAQYNCPEIISVMRKKIIDLTDPNLQKKCWNTIIEYLFSYASPEHVVIINEKINQLINNNK